MKTHVYTRHKPQCPHRAKPAHRGCKCPKWIYIERTRQRVSAKTRSWETAEQKADLMADGKPVQAADADEKTTISEAIEKYVDDKRLQNLADSTLSKLDNIFRKHLGQFCQDHGIVYPEGLTLAKVQQFRASWRDQALARKKKQERLAGFFRFCIAQKWASDNPAKHLSKVQVKDTPTLYFPQQEIQILLASVGRMYADKRGLNGSSPESLRRKVTALVFLLRWSGLRIGDAVSLERSRLQHDGHNWRIFLYTAKTGTPVCVPIPEHVGRMLHGLPNSNPKYFFWTGNGLVKTAVADWQRTLRRLFKLAVLDKRCHPHMFRDTFAVEMLLAGVPLDQVSILLGHSSVRITEKHYAPWVHARQQQLELSVRKAWTVDPLAGDESARTSVSIN